MDSQTTPHPSSYRDPSGYIFEKEGIIYRQVNQSFRQSFEQFINSGCYAHLVKHGLLVPHEVINQNLTGDREYYLTLKPERIPFISYPYEWSFEMLKDAALLTLQLVRESLAFGMILKDATPFNVQWRNGRLVFIDTLSFETYEEKPWIAYRQFCESFLGPLLIMHYSKRHLPALSLAWPEGIPLHITRTLLPWRSRLSLHSYLHIFMHGNMAAKPGKVKTTAPVFSRQKLLNLLSSLETLVSRLKVPDQSSTWSDYYSEASQRENYLIEKKQIIQSWVEELPGIKTAADLGANDGEFSKLIAGRDIQCLSADFDPYCINRLYKEIKKTGERNLQPMILDLAQPSPAIGVNNEERSSFSQRVHSDLVLALALIHHLAIGKNIPFGKIARFFSDKGKWLIIEYVPKEDEKVQVMLSNKKDIYPWYTKENFLEAFSLYFNVEKSIALPGSSRTLFLLGRK